MSSGNTERAYSRRSPAPPSTTTGPYSTCSCPNGISDTVVQVAGEMGETVSVVDGADTSADDDAEKACLKKAILNCLPGMYYFL